MDVMSHNRDVWNQEVNRNNPWTIPVSSEQVTEARNSTLKLLLTPTKYIPAAWMGQVKGKDVLCLASGGGQQGPLLAAAGGNVTVLDLSPAQLNQDRLVVERENLTIHLVEGNMQDLSVFPSESFDLIIHPVSNCFIPDVLSVWKGAYRVLRKNGRLLSGFNNPIMYIFDFEQVKKGKLKVSYALPYADILDMPPAQLKKYVKQGNPLEFSHTLEEQIGGQTAAGFVIAGFYEDVDPKSVISNHFPEYLATLAIKQ